MKAAIVKMGDAMLRRVLPAAEAGACIPEVGQPCRCGSPCGATWCTQYRFACNGVCHNAGTRC
jgi:hypothetical protein